MVELKHAPRGFVTALSCVLLLGLGAASCAPTRQEIRAQLPPDDRALLVDYERYMTEERIERFLAAATPETRMDIVREVRLERMLSRWEPRVRSAILRGALIEGMHVYAMLIAWGRPAGIETLGAGDDARELWTYEGEDTPRDGCEVVVIGRSVHKAWCDSKNTSVLEAPRPADELAALHQERGEAFTVKGRPRLARVELELAELLMRLARAPSHH